MKHIVALIFASLLGGTLWAQPISYFVTYLPNAGNPGTANTTADNDITGWTEILDDSLFANTWSAPQVLPFPFQFFGTAVTQFKVSANGLITFNTATGLLPGPNQNLPSAVLPDQTIACFWDDFTPAVPTGAGDKVYTRVFGAPGSQQLWIKWFSFEYGSPSGNSYNYMACVLEQSTNRIYLVDMAFSGNVPFMSTTVGLQQNATKAVQYGDSTITFDNANSSGTSNNGYYQFVPYQQFPNDGVLVSIDEPAGSGCLSPTTQVTITLTNIGSNTLSNLTATFTVDAGPPSAPETIPFSLATGDTVSFTFTATADLSAPGPHTLAANLTVPSDGNPSNNAKSISLSTLPAVSVPYLETFDSGLPTNWINDPNDGGEDWRNSANGTASNGPGSTDHTSGSGNYMWVDDSSPHSNPTNLITPCFDLTGLSFPVMDFWVWSSNGDTTRIDMELHVDLESNGIWVEDIVPPILDLSPAWIQIQKDLFAYAGEVVRIRFRMVESGGGFLHDIAIDDFQITEAIGADVVLLGFSAPAGDGCGFSAAEPISIRLTNQGINPIGGVSAIFAVNGGTPSAPEIIPTTLQPGDTIDYTFTATADLSALGLYTLAAAVTASGDANPANDSILVNIANLPVVQAPYLETFDSGLPNTWFNDPNDGTEDWRNSGTGNAGFGAGATDHTSGTGRYMWVDDSSPHNATVNLSSPCLDLSQMTAPQLEFWVWSENSDTTRDDMLLHLDLQVNGVWILDVITPIGHLGPGWNQVLFDLLPYAGTILRVRFRAEEVDTGFQHDISIDDVRIFEELPFDVAILGIDAPVVDACDLALEPVTIRVVNQGTNPATGIQARYALNAAAPIAPETIPGTLAPGDTLSYTFTTLADLTALGVYTFTATATLPNDGNNFNDSTSSSVEHLGPVALPVTENFDTYPIGTTTFADWINADITDVPWQANTGPTASGSTGPGDDASGGGGYAYLEASGTNQGNQAIFCLPCMDLSGASNPFFLFAYHMYGSATGSLRVVVDDGSGPAVLWQISGQQQASSSAPWLRDTVDLTPYIGSVISVCLVGEVGTDGQGNTFNSDIAVDELEVKELVANDVGITAMLLPEAGCGLTATEQIGIRVRNFGTQPATGVLARLFLDGVPAGPAEIIPGSIPDGSTVDYVFTSTVDLSALGTYELGALLTYPGDAEASNDTLTGTAENLPLVSTFPYLEDFEGGAGNWRSTGTLVSWALGTPAKLTISGAASGTQAWTTGGLGTGTYNPDERSVVLSPCFDMSGLSGDLWVAAKVWWESEAGADGTVLQVSTNGGTSWANVGAVGAPDNWFNDAAIAAQPGGQSNGWAGRQATGNGSGGWVQARHPLPGGIAGAPEVRFRFAFAAGATGQDDGFAFDDFALGVPPVVDLGPDTLSTCPGTVLDAGGGPGFTYLWSTGATTPTLTLTNTTGAFIFDSLISVVVIDTLGLVGTDSIVVTLAPAAPTVDASISMPITCFGGNDGVAFAQATGGTGTLTLSWNTNPPVSNPVLLNLTAGTYIVTATDANGCVAVDSVVIGQPAEILAIPDTIIAESCPGEMDGAILITLSGGTGNLAFTWDSGDTTEDLTGIGAGQYTMTLTDDNGCTATSGALTVGLQNEIPQASFSYVNNNGTVSFTNTSVGTGSFAWDFGDASGTSTDPNPVYTYAQSGAYEVTMILINDCGTSIINDSVFVLITGLDAALDQQLHVAPNPTQGQLTLRFEGTTAPALEVSLVALDGRTVLARQLRGVYGTYETTLELPGTLARGLYLLRVQGPDGQVFRRIRLE